ncbi:MAG: zinc-dependent metalloprotease [Holophagales bacterium]|jgi:hypothetical protein|nr:zinc-dependent metalloprotease [Holophagales bacterium]
MSKKTLPTLTLLLALGMVPLLAQSRTQATPQTPAGAAATPPDPNALKEFAEIIKDAQESKGFFTVFQKEDKVWLEIGESQLDKPFLMSWNLAKGIGEAGLYSGMMGDSILVAFRRVGNTMRLMALNTAFQADNNKSLKLTLDNSFSESLLNAVPVLSKPNTERKSVLIDASALMLKDYPGLASGLGRMYRQGYSFDRGNTTFEKIRITEKQSSFLVSSHFSLASVAQPSPSTPPGMAPSTPDNVPDPRSLFLGIIYNFLQLPETPMAARLADDRIGFFVNTQWDFAKEDIELRKRFINRWRLEKKDPSLAVSEPKEPIVYWIDKGVPEKYKQTIAEGILEWNKAFEKAGFKNAIEVKFQPDDADWDTLDARHASIRWLVGTDVSFAIGPSHVDPRTGEILDADIGIGEFWVRSYPREFREDIAPKTGAMHMSTGRAGIITASELTEMPFAMDLLEARGELDPLSPEGEEFVKECLRELITHEVGHTLGLRHNFKASTAYTEAQLNDPEFTKKNGLANSVMDYVPVNLPLEGQKRGQLMSGAIGPWDYWVIEYGYKQFDPSKEADELAKIAGRSDDPLLIYGTDEDSSFGIDPDVNTYDLGPDTLAYAAKRIQLSAELIKRLQNRTFKPGEPYHILRRQTNRALNQVANSVSFASKYIGGVSYNRDHAGTSRTNMTPVPADRQREALKLLEKQIFSMDSFKFTPEFLSRLTSDRVDYNDLSSPTYSPSRLMLAIQKYALSRMMATGVAQNILDASEKQTNAKQVFKLSELYDTLQSAIWAELRGGKEPTMARRSLQREHLRSMINVLLRATTSMPDDARNLIRENMRQLKTQLQGAAARAASKETKAHYNECIALIDDSFKASLQRATF